MIRFNKTMLVGFLSAAWLIAMSIATAVAQEPSHGPAKGSLLITGGLTEPPDIKRFIEMAGGKNARIIFIPTANVTEPTSLDKLQDLYCGPKSVWAEAHCTVLHTTDRTVANSEEFVAPLKTATGVWIVGGRQWRLTDAYLGTRTLTELFNVLDRGGAIGGGSAGASVQGSYMVRGSSDPDDNTIMMAPGHEVGFGFFRNVAIDQHVDARHRENDLAPVMKAHPNLLGIGLDQGTSITVHGDLLTVNGPKRVLVWDGKDHNGRGYYYLLTGDQLNTATRVATLVPHPPTIDQSLEMRSVGAPKISPDGQRVVYEQVSTDWEANAFLTGLWIADVATGDSHKLTVDAKSSNDAAWSPDGRWIAFLSDRVAPMAASPAGKRQLYVMPSDGGEAQQLTKMENGVEAFAWMPDSQRIVLTAEAPETKAMKDRKESFGEYHVFRADYAMLHLWLTTLPETDATGKTTPFAEPKLLTPGEAFSVGSFSVSPDGTKVAFSAQRDPDLVSAFSSDIYTVNLANTAVKKIVETPGPDTGPQWSSDGKEIAYVTANASPNFFYTNRRIAVVGSEGGTPRVLTMKFDEDPTLLKWGPDGIYFSALQKTASSLFVLDPKTDAVRALVMPGSELAGQFTFSKDFKAVAYRGAGANKYADIYVDTLVTKAGDTPKLLTHAEDQLTLFKTARREVVRWKSGDGTTVEGILYKPFDFDPHKKYPLLVVIHGGPTGVDTPAVSADRYYPVERFIAKGALVLRPNYRGSAGYGEAFRSLNVRNLGVGDYADVISGVDFLIAQGFVDKDRVGSMGWSEGGYISAFITTSSDRFKAVSVGAGISDWMTYYVNTDITPFTRQYLQATPWDDPEIYKKTSPISYISKAKTPTLIQQGGADKRVPVADSFELRQALEDHNVPVKLVIYDGFGHPVNKPKQQRAVMEENENWFDHYIWGDPLAPALIPIVKPAKP